MKKYILTLALLMCCSWFSFAQDKGFKLSYLSEVGTKFKKNDLVSTFSITPGYLFGNNVYVGIPISGFYNMYRNGNSGSGMVDYSFLLGGNVGYNIKTSDINMFILSGGFGGSAYAGTYDSLYYDISGKWSITMPISFVIGLGVRYYQSLDNNYKDFVTAYASIGFMLNFSKK